VEDLARRHRPSTGERVGLTGGPGAGKTLLAEELTEAGLTVTEGEDVDARVCAVLLELIVPEEVLLRRLEGRDLRSAGAVARQAVLARLEAHRARLAAPGAVAIEAANALGPLPPGPGDR
jgi:hypothetical protein